MICLVDNENKSTSSRIIVYAFKKIVLMVSKIALIVHTREIFVLFFPLLLLDWREEMLKQKIFNIFFKRQIYWLIGVGEGMWRNTFRIALSRGKVLVLYSLGITNVDNPG